MPTYVYRCDPCADNFEYTHSIHEDRTYTCTVCKTKLRRVPQAAGIILKGSGFHKTENRQEEDNG